MKNLEFEIRNRKSVFLFFIFYFLFSDCCFSQSPFQLNGSTTQLSTNCYQLTPDTNSQVGTMWCLNQLNLTNPFQVQAYLFFGCKDTAGADGIVFGLQQVSTSAGSAGSGIGFNGISPSLGIEFDTWDNTPFYTDPWYDHIGIIKNGVMNHTGANSLAGPVQASAASPNIEDGQYHFVEVKWDPVPKTIEVYFDGVFRTSYTGNIVSTIFNNNPNVYWGFTSATGGNSNLQQVCLVYSPATYTSNLPDTTICLGASITMNAGTGGTSYSWSPSSGLSCVTCQNPIATPSVSTNYIVYIANPNGCGIRTDTAKITVALPPAIAISGNTTVCAGGNFTLTASGGNNYSWSTGQTTSSISISPTTTTSYSVIVTDANGCTNDSSVTINVNPTPVASISGSTTICPGNSVTLSASGGNNYSWNTGATTSSITVTPTSTATFSVIVSSGNCSDTASATVTVNSSLVASISGNTTICAGDSATLTASGGNFYSWSNGVTTSSVSVSPTVNATYSVIVSSGSGCSDSASVNIVVNPPPVATASGNTTICPGQSATLTASGGNNYSWNTGATTSSISVTPTSSTTYSVIVFSGTCSDTTSATVTIFSSASASISGNMNLCQGDSTTLSASGGISYSWNTGATTSSISLTLTSTSTFSVIITNANGCTAAATATVVVSPPPLASVSPNTTVCIGENVMLTASGGNNYSWNTGATTSSISLTLTSTSSYSVIVSDGNCSDTASATIAVVPLPIVNAGADVTIASGQSTTLNGSGGTGYQWIPSTDLSCSNCQNPIANPNTTTTYTLIVTDANGCTSSALVTVFVEIVCGDIFLPNAFSPNGDGENDALRIFYGSPECISSFHLLIYNRWGEKIYETSDPLFKWDGNYNKGILKSMNQEPNTQVYIYYMEAVMLNGNKIKKQGNISLIR